MYQKEVRKNNSEKNDWRLKKISGKMNKCGLDIPNFYKPYKNFGNTFEIEEGWLEVAFHDYNMICEREREREYENPGEDKIIESITQLYNFSSYYNYLLLDQIKTPKSIICSMKNLDVENIFNEFLSNLKENNNKTETENTKVFVRVDRMSAKTYKGYNKFEEAYNDLIKSEKTREYVFSKLSNYIFREYISNIEDMIELRCFVFQKRLRGISFGIDFETKFKNIDLFKIMVRTFVNKITFSTELEDSTIDLCIDKNQISNLFNNISINLDSLTLIEINTPVYLLATSRLFELDLPSHKSIFVGEYQPDIISYPVILIQTNSTIFSILKYIKLYI